jgi:hypothetical protein
MLTPRALSGSSFRSSRRNHCQWHSAEMCARAKRGKPCRLHDPANQPLTAGSWHVINCIRADQLLSFFLSKATTTKSPLPPSSSSLWRSTTVTPPDPALSTITSTDALNFGHVPAAAARIPKSLTGARLILHHV